jgi:protein-tyrosine phosphatase
MDQIIPHLYLSNWIYSNNIEELRRKNIRAVITIETSPKPEYILKYYKDNNIDFLYLPLYDFPTQNIQQYFNTSYNFIQKHVILGENVLVHCMAGISRSATLVLNYLVCKTLTENISQKKCATCTVNKCLNYMKFRRAIVNPNEGFYNQVLTYSKNYI